MSLRARTWTALMLPPVAWFVFEQGLSALLHASCSQVGIGVVWGIVTLIVCAVAPRIARVSAQATDVLADIWLARLTRAVAAIFALATAFQTLAALLVPACVR